MKAKTLLSILKSTGLGSADVGQISEDLRVIEERTWEVLTSLADEGLVEVRGSSIHASGGQRMRIASMALEAGVDVEEVCRCLRWKEFEDVATLALEAYDFSTLKHFRFKASSRGYEVDILGFRKPTILSMECKHWKRSWQRSATVKFANAHKCRTDALAQTLPKVRGRLPIEEWSSAKVMPVILTLSETPLKVHYGVPIVSMFHFSSFLSEMSAYGDHLRSLFVNLA